jgi:predicted kinase
MDRSQATLYLICGKIASGKSTLTATLAARPATILISEDKWLAHLYRAEMNSVGDYIRYNARLREAMAPHVAQLLRAGTNVVLDFPANTVKIRAWMKEIVESTGAKHELHYLDVPDEVCMSRLRERNAAGTHQFLVSEVDFVQVTSYFVPPGDSEGFNVITHRLA